MLVCFTRILLNVRLRKTFILEYYAPVAERNIKHKGTYLQALPFTDRGHHLRLRGSCIKAGLGCSMRETKMRLTTDQT